MKKLNITFLDFDDIKNPLLGGGQARATKEVATCLIQRGHKITVICSRYPGSKDRTDNGITYKHIALGSKNIRLNNIIYILLLPFYVRKIKDTNIIVECFTAPISTLFSPLFTKIPVVALTTSFEAEMFGKVYHLPFKRVESIGVKRYKYFLPYTQYYENKIKKLNKKAVIKLVPEGVGKEFFEIKKQKPKYILFLGRLDINQKGIDLLLNAYKSVKDEIKYPLVIAGNGPDENKVKEMINDLGLNDKVKMTGPTFGSKKKRILEEALFVAFPSRHEGFSLFSLEALASGLPLISFDIPGLSWAGKDISVKAKKYDIKDYSSKLLVANDDKKIVEMSKNARKFAKNYTWEKVASEFESFFYQILKKERAKYAN